MEECQARTPMEETMEESIMSLKSAAFYIPKDDYRHPSGDDAHFICDEKCTIGVADGVGGWTKRGVDAGEYARQLMSNSMLVVQNCMGYEVDPQEVLALAYHHTVAKGSSTACIITVKENCLHAANLGDSGFVVIRKGKTIYQSPVQQYRFNHPYQLGVSKECDNPSSADIFVLPVEVGDVIVAGTDGLFDNMFITEIESAVSFVEGLEPEEVAIGIAQLAYSNSYNKSSTPFEVASKQANKTHVGGKVDDITVIVSYVQQKQKEITDCADMEQQKQEEITECADMEQQKQEEITECADMDIG